ncbi:unnamed protein product [Meganyctiphanes norvegica]|uniref:Uncharacterized protein n=1 Tax=Meganyctiphanes norvegica TaxID=48144 RepID=A0AAV2S2E3_MEGNR
MILCFVDIIWTMTQQIQIYHLAMQRKAMMDDGDAEVDSDEDDGDTEQYSDLDDGDAEEDNTIDDRDAEEDNNVDYGDSEEDNDVDDGVAEEDNYVDDGDSDEDNYVDDGDAEEDNYVDDGGGDEDSEEEDQYDEVDDEDYSGDDYNGYYSSGDLYDQDYYNDWFNNLIDSDDVASGDQDDTTEDPNIILYSKDTIEANETFGDTGDGGAFIIFSTSCVIMACLLGFLYWRRRQLEDDEIPIFSRGANDDYSVPEYQDEPNEDDRLTAKQQNYKSYN